MLSSESCMIRRPRVLYIPRERYDVVIMQILLFVLLVPMYRFPFAGRYAFVFWEAIQILRLWAFCFCQLAARNVIGFDLASPHVRNNRASEGENLVINSISPRRN